MPGICCYELAVMRSAEIFSCSKSSLRTSYQLQTPSNTAPREWQDAFSMRKFRSFCKWHILHVPPYFFPLLRIWPFELNTLMPWSLCGPPTSLTTVYFRLHFCLLHPVGLAEGSVQSPLLCYFFPKSLQEKVT